MQYQQRIKTLNRSLRQFTFIIITRPPLRAHKPWELEYGRTSADRSGDTAPWRRADHDAGQERKEKEEHLEGATARTAAPCMLYVLIWEINKIIKWLLINSTGKRIHWVQ